MDRIHRDLRKKKERKKKEKQRSSQDQKFFGTLPKTKKTKRQKDKKEKIVPNLSYSIQIHFSCSPLSLFRFSPQPFEFGLSFFPSLPSSSS